MNSMQIKSAPVHRFSVLQDIHFRFITITEANFQEPDVAHRHNYWSVFFFQKGTGKHTIDFTTLETQKGSIHFVLPGQLHSLEAGEEFQAYVLLFTEEFFFIREETKNLLLNLYECMDTEVIPAINLDENGGSFFENLMQLFIAEYNLKSTQREEILLNLLAVFVSKCAQLMKLEPLPANSLEVSNYILFRKEVEKNYRKLHTVSDYANALNLTNKTLNEISQQFVGITAHEFIHQRLFLEIKRLLKYSQKPIKQIAYDLNFTDAAHLTKFFKLKTGTTPQEFRTKG